MPPDAKEDETRGRDLTEPAVRSLLDRLTGRKNSSVEAVSSTSSNATFAVVLSLGDERWAAEVVAHTAPYSHGCGTLYLALLDASSERVEVGFAHTVASGRSGEGRLVRPWLKRLGLRLTYADRLVLEAGRLGKLRTALSVAVDRHGVTPEAVAAHTRPLKRPGVRSRPSSLSDRQRDARRTARR